MNKKNEITVVNPSEGSFEQTLDRVWHRHCYNMLAEFIPWALSKVSTFAGEMLTDIGEHYQNKMTMKAEKYRQ